MPVTAIRLTRSRDTAGECEQLAAGRASCRCQQAHPVALAFWLTWSRAPRTAPHRGPPPTMTTPLRS
jgi:hypothetical protein